MKVYEISYGQHKLRYAFHYEKTPLYMRPYIRLSENEEYDILSPIDYMEELRPYYTENQDDDYVEYKSLINLSSLALLRENGVFFHAVAIRYKQKAWLFIGRSGTGKTTQYKNWKKRYRDQIELICGDMPYLELNDGNIHVYPSPWNGKERFKGKADAPLGGIVFLEKGDHNEIREMSVKEALAPLFHQFAVEPQNEEDIRQLSNIADVLLKKYPVIKLINKADQEAVELCSKYLEKYL
ncbi:MAG: hypothetical protein IJI44_04335 [Erysipelotrichaceae bacterium]|nr:hypothetical protein [Erysipelotrichaceae bacterium]